MKFEDKTPVEMMEYVTSELTKGELSKEGLTAERKEELRLMIHQARAEGEYMVGEGNAAIEQAADMMNLMRGEDFSAPQITDVEQWTVRLNDIERRLMRKNLSRSTESTLVDKTVEIEQELLAEVKIAEHRLKQLNDMRTRCMLLEEMFEA